MMPRAFRRGRTVRGQALVEFALVLPLIVLMFMGVFDLGRGIFAYNEVSNAAREGTRTGIVNQNLSDIRARAAAQAVSLGIPAAQPTGCPALDGPPTDPAGICVTLLTPDLSAACTTPPTVGCVADVTVKYTYQPITPIIGTLIGSLTLVSTSREPIESVCTTAGCPIP